MEAGGKVKQCLVDGIAILLFSFMCWIFITSVMLCHRDVI